MKKRYLQTNFIKFLIEKYEKEIQELPEEETNLSDNKLSDEFDRIINGEALKTLSNLSVFALHNDFLDGFP
jgi:hypothetical protein